MDNHDWTDILPIVQDDGQTPLCPIAYEQDYQTAMNYFRAIVKAKEYSQRALDLTTDLLLHNSSHYTVWKYRLDIILALGSDLDAEWIFLNDLAVDNPKSYQIWHQRQALALKASTGEAEMEFINRMLVNDSKNYHCWSYRQWVVKTWEMWDFEIRDVERLILEDVRNNSAWNQRFFVITNRPEALDEKIYRNEVDYTMNMIAKAPGNESPWNYLQGSKNLEDYPDIMNKVLAMADEKKRFSMVALVNYYQLKNNAIEYKRICRALMEVDSVRHNYWKYRLEKQA